MPLYYAIDVNRIQSLLHLGNFFERESARAKRFRNCVVDIHFEPVSHNELFNKNQGACKFIL